MSHATLESFYLDQTDPDAIPILPHVLSVLESPEWSGAIETFYTFKEEKLYITDWLVRSRDRMPRLRDLKMRFSLDDWSLGMERISDGGGCHSMLEDLFYRKLVVEAAVQGSGPSDLSTQVSARWEHSCDADISRYFDMETLDGRQR
jgi:hypothetical protein